jgi:hypothetical protein
MNVDWIAAYNKLFKIINNNTDDNYYSGSSFLQMAQQVDDRIPNYTQFIKARKQQGLSTSRKDFYWDVINDLQEEQKYRLFRLFIEALDSCKEIENVRAAVFDDGMAAPITIIPQNLWNSEKLNSSLKEIDSAIDAQQFNREVAIALCIATE